VSQGCGGPWRFGAGRHGTLDLLVSVEAEAPNIRPCATSHFVIRHSCFLLSLPQGIKEKYLTVNGTPRGPRFSDAIPEYSIVL
jgi:hypothetical protein